MADDGAYFRNTITKHVDDDVTFYADFGPWLPASVTISSPSVTCPDDAALVIANVAVIGTSTTVNDRVGTRTIAANEGVSFELSSGTAIADAADSVDVEIAVTLSNGDTITRLARLRVKE